MWECPDFFPLGGRQVLLVTAQVRTTWYVVGEWEDRRFTADAPNQRWVGDTTEFVIGESGPTSITPYIRQLCQRGSV